MEEWLQRCNIVDFTKGGRGQSPGMAATCGSRKGKEGFPLEPSERNAAPLTAHSSPSWTLSTADLQICETTNAYHLQPLNAW